MTCAWSSCTTQLAYKLVYHARMNSVHAWFTLAKSEYGLMTHRWNAHNQVPSKLIWCDHIWCDHIWCDHIWCDHIWCDHIWCDHIWCDHIWCDHIWCDHIKCCDQVKKNLKRRWCIEQNTKMNIVTYYVFEQTRCLNIVTYVADKMP